VTGQGNPDGVEVKDVKKETVPFTPYATLKDGYAIGAFLVLYAWMTFFVPNYLGHPDNYIEANPLVTPPHIVPEWYFLPFYAILRAIPSKLIGVIALFLSILILAALPWLDTSKVKSGSYRPQFRKAYWAFIATCVGLGYLGSQPAEGAFLWIARILTFYYFFHFVCILPWLSRHEKTEPVPESIEAAVNGRGVSHA
jgi:ubiquinol-cytochrome c reductase cytochrome b subunit